MLAYKPLKIYTYNNQIFYSEVLIMIQLNVTFNFANTADRDAFLSSMTEAGVVAKTQAEEGNIRFDFYLPTANDTSLFLMEQWADQDAIASHGKQEHYLYLQEVKKQLVTSTDVNKIKGEKI